ncbi:MAG: hypothetical protein ICV69_08650 [Thermoleophilaceae bacterium]|nr:hypothetical protein [Thermoleophilaceae bacterium]
MLRNVQLTGKVEYDDEVFDASHEPIVDEETFARARALLESHVSRRGRRPNGRHLFRGGKRDVDGGCVDRRPLAQHP